MSTKKKTGARKMRSYNDAFKTEALALAKQVGVAKAAKELGVYDSQIDSWRSKAEHEQSVSEREKEQLAEIARLKRELSQTQEENHILKKASAYFAKQLR